jgi:hypothetical protein
MANLSLRNLIPGKKYRMVIEADTADGNIKMPYSVEFTVPEACPHARNFALQIKKTTFQVKNTNGKMVTKTRLYFKIPPQIMKNLIWKSDVKDVVWIVYRSADSKENLTSDRKYLVGNGTFSFGTIPTFNPSVAPWTGSHPAVFYKNIDPKNYLTFQFVVARYVNINGSWQGYWLHNGRNSDEVLSRQVAFGG